MIRVLIGVATYPTSAENPQGIYPQTQASLDALQFDGEMAIDFWGGDDPALDPWDNLTNKHNQMRERALALGYDALLTVEADMVVPPDALQRLAAVEADVVYGTYCSRHKDSVLTFPTIHGYTGRSISADPEQWRAKFGTVIPSEGVGFGCTLIRRRVLEAIEFRRDKSTSMRRKFADDWTWVIDVKEAGFRSATHLGVLCGHIQRDGRVRWPDASTPDFVSVQGEVQAAGTDLPARGQYRCRKWLSGPTQDYAPGTVVELSAEAAAILLSLGKIEMI